MKNCLYKLDLPEHKIIENSKQLDIMDACSLMNKKKGQSVLYALFPEMSNLCCAICKIDFVEVHDASTKSNFHWQRMKCR